jgi:hypothetical protein
MLIVIKKSKKVRKNAWIVAKHYSGLDMSFQNIAYISIFFTSANELVW